MKSLPKVFSFPNGRKITIELVDDLKMAELVGQGHDGCWLDHIPAIYIRKALPLSRQWYMLTHELLHAVVDWQGELIVNGVAKP